jgi:hypothetical protein
MNTSPSIHSDGKYLAARVIVLAARVATNVHETGKHISYMLDESGKQLTDLDLITALSELQKPLIWKAKLTSDIVHIATNNIPIWGSEFDKSRKESHDQFLVDVQNMSPVKGRDFSIRVYDSVDDFLLSLDALNHLLNDYTYDVKSNETIGFSVDTPSVKDKMHGADARLLVTYGTSSIIFA